MNVPNAGGMSSVGSAGVLSPTEQQLYTMLESALQAKDNISTTLLDELKKIETSMKKLSEQLAKRKDQQAGQRLSGVTAKLSKLITDAKAGKFNSAEGQKELGRQIVALQSEIDEAKKARQAGNNAGPQASAEPPANGLSTIA